MDVLFLAHSYPREPGDAPGSFLLRLARALREEDVRVTVVAPGAPRLRAYEELDGVPVHRFRYAPRRYETLAYGGSMARLVRESWSARVALVSFLGSGFRCAVRVRRQTGAQLVHAHWWFPGGLVGSWLASLSGVPLVTTLHGTDLRLARDVRVARAPFRRVLGASGAVTTVSHWLADEVRTLVPDIDPVVAPMPVATELFQHPAAHARTPARSTDLLFVGRLTAQKGVDRLLRALAVLPAHSRLDVIGAGPEEEALHRLASELGISDRVHWLGAMPQPALAEHYRRAAVLVVPSREEGLGLVGVEAMLCGTPVVAFDSGGLRDVVQHERTGLLVPEGDVDALAAALRGLLGADAAGRRAEMGEAARLYALATFAPEAAARRYATIYRDVLQRRRSP